MRRLAAVAVCVFVGVLVPRALAAQAATDGSQLGFYLGKWNAEGQSRPTPTGAFGKLTGQETCAWFSGGPSVVCRETSTDAAGETDSIYILAYDAGRKLFTVYGTDNTGAITSGTGSVDNGVWRWTAEMRAAGKTTPMRYTFKSGPGGSRTMDVEVASGKGAWAKIQSITYKIAR